MDAQRVGTGRGRVGDKGGGRVRGLVAVDRGRRVG